MFTFEVLAGRYAVCGLTVMPHIGWDETDLLCVSRTRNQVTLICLEAALKPEFEGQVERDWRALHLLGTYAFDLVGVLAEISRVLAEAHIGIFAISTYDTDYILVKDENLFSAIEALQKAGHSVISGKQS